MNVRNWLLPLMTALFVGIVGCGESKLAVIPVSGVVEYKGKPVVNASVTFQPENGKAASGVTNEKGEFTLRTYEDGDGAIPGSHKVTIVAINAPKGKDELTGDSLKIDDVNEPIPGDDLANVKSTKIPEKYASNDTSELTFSVESSGENSPKFVLQD